MNMINTYGSSVRKRRKALGYSITSLANKVGIAPAFLNFIEHSSDSFLAQPKFDEIKAQIDLTLNTIRYQRILYAVKENKIQVNDILRLACPKINKVILISAFYSVNNLGHLQVKFLKEQLKEMADDVNNEKIIKQLLEFSNSKKQNIFNFNFYLYLLIGKKPNNEPSKIQKTAPSSFYLEDLKKIKKLITRKKYNEALDICNKVEYRFLSCIQFLHVKILTTMGLLDEALAICDMKPFEKDVAMQYQKVLILQLLGNKEDALQLCEMPRFAHDSGIQYQRINLLVNENRIDEAILVGSNPILSNHPEVKNIMDNFRKEKALRLVRVLNHVKNQNKS